MFPHVVYVYIHIHVFYVFLLMYVYIYIYMRLYISGIICIFYLYYIHNLYIWVGHIMGICKDSRLGAPTKSPGFEL